MVLPAVAFDVSADSSDDVLADQGDLDAHVVVVATEARAVSRQAFNRVDEDVVRLGFKAQPVDLLSVRFHR